VISGHWAGLGLSGLGGTMHELFARFPADVIAADAELAAGMAATSWPGDRWKKPSDTWRSPPGR